MINHLLTDGWVVKRATVAQDEYKAAVKTWVTVATVKGAMGRARTTEAFEGEAHTNLQAYQIYLAAGTDVQRYDRIITPDSETYEVLVARDPMSKGWFMALDVQRVDQ